MRIGVIGTGSIINRFLEAISEIDNITCVAIYSRDRFKGEGLANEFDIETVYTDLDGMLNDVRIDFIYVASPNSLHYEHSFKALEKGKNVICEKPFTSTLEETINLINIAKKKNLFLFEAITTIHLPNYKLIKENVKRLGNIKMIQANYSQYSSRYDQLLAGEIPNVFNVNFSGGALVDLNIYNLHFVIGIFGEPETISYFVNKHKNGIDTSGSLILKYPNFISVCTGCKDVWGENFAQIQGEDGYIYVDKGANECVSFTVKINKEEPETFNIQDKTNILYYEMQEFSKIYKEQDFKLCYELLEHTKAVIRVATAARRYAGIVFKADEK